MAELTKIGPAHLRREAWVYVRQSTMTQVRENTESLKRQYELVERAHRLGWPADRVRVIDDDVREPRPPRGWVFRDWLLQWGWARSAWCWASRCLG